MNPALQHLSKILALLTTFLLTTCSSILPTATGEPPSLAAATLPYTLNGTQWQLQQIQSMDDSLYTPQQPDDYTLSFLPLGQLSGKAHCNRITGSWVQTGPAQLGLSQLATTRAFCSPDEVYDRFLADLNHISSFVLQDGNLYLATVADGSILEFTPVQKEGNGQRQPAFECSEAEGTAEELICNDAGLARLDLVLDSLFQAALANFPEQDIRTLRAEQRGWISGRNDCWKADEPRLCIMENYQLRIAELQVRSGFLGAPEPFTFECEDEDRLTVHFYSNALHPVAMLNKNGEQHLAYLTRSASGSRYQAGNIVFWDRGQESLWQELETSQHCFRLKPAR